MIVETTTITLSVTILLLIGLAVVAGPVIRNWRDAVRELDAITKLRQQNNTLSAALATEKDMVIAMEHRNKLLEEKNSGLSGLNQRLQDRNRQLEKMNEENGERFKKLIKHLAAKGLLDDDVVKYEFGFS
jgi:vacuolar-type H+-ATPase subunit E/Vma4